MSVEFPTDAERDALVNHAAWWNDGAPDLRTDDLIEVLRPLVAAREAAAWDAGADVAWQRSTPEVNGLHYHWRSSGEPLNPYRQEARR